MEKKKVRSKNVLKFCGVYRRLRLDWFSELTLIQIYLFNKLELSLITENFTSSEIQSRTTQPRWTKALKPEEQPSC